MEKFLQIARKKQVPFIVLLSAFFLTLLIVINSKSFQKSKIFIESDKNKFHLKFDIAGKDQPKFLEFLAKLNAPRSILLGAEFELDSTSSAKLAFATPIEGSLNEISNRRVSFSGTYSGPSQQLTKRENFKIPNSTVLAVFGSDFRDFFKSKFPLPLEFTAWIDQNLISQNGQYLLFLNPPVPQASAAVEVKEPKVAVAFKNPNINLEDLKDLQTQNQTIEYKKDYIDNIIIHLLNVSSKQEKITFAFFQQDQWTYLVSSLDVLDTLIGASKKDDSIAFNSQAVIFRSSPELISQNFYGQVATEKIAKILEVIDYFELTLKANRFSALIILK